MPSGSELVYMFDAEGMLAKIAGDLKREEKTRIGGLNLPQKRASQFSCQQPPSNILMFGVSSRSILLDPFHDRGIPKELHKFQKRGCSPKFVNMGARLESYFWCKMFNKIDLKDWICALLRCVPFATIVGVCCLR